MIPRPAIAASIAGSAVLTTSREWIGTGKSALRSTVFAHGSALGFPDVLENAPAGRDIVSSRFGQRQFPTRPVEQPKNCSPPDWWASATRELVHDHEHPVALHLKRILTSYFNYRWCTQLSPGMDSPEFRSVQQPDLEKVVQFPEVGDLPHHYERLSA